MWPSYMLAAATVGASIWDDRTSEPRSSTRHASPAGSKPTPDRGHQRLGIARECHRIEVDQLPQLERQLQLAQTITEGRLGT
jgi:hypothetical protein